MIIILAIIFHNDEKDDNTATKEVIMTTKSLSKNMSILQEEDYDYPCNDYHNA